MLFSQAALGKLGTMLSAGYPGSKAGAGTVGCSAVSSARRRFPWDIQGGETVLRPKGAGGGAGSMAVRLAAPGLLRLWGSAAQVVVPHGACAWAASAAASPGSARPGGCCKGAPAPREQGPAPGSDGEAAASGVRCWGREPCRLAQHPALLHPPGKPVSTTSKGQEN